MSYRTLVAKPLNIRLRDIWEGARLGRRLAQVATGFGALSPLMALANPTGGQVVGGHATISNPTANGTLINQASQSAAINWQQFTVAGNQYVQFVQPNSSSVVLNRVIGGAPSSIFGNITANGQVFLINPNGILFGRGATLDVGGLMASTQAISDADFMAGHYGFLKGSGAPDASVINQGAITAKTGYVVLAGDYVENDGVINARSGKVLLAAGGGTTLTLDQSQGLISYSINSATLARLAGANNTGNIMANGGTVIMTADVANALTATAVNNSGFVSAHSITSRNGVIILTAKGGDIENSGTLDASASQPGIAGGTIILRGDGHTTVTSTGVVDTEGDGAKGGYVELSGHQLNLRGMVNPGQGGSLLYDPSSIKILSGASHTGANGSVGTGYINTTLGGGVSLTLVAAKTIKVTTGTIITAAGPGNLELRVGNLISIGGTLGGANCFVGGVCKPGLGANNFSAVAGGTINLSGLTINIAGNFGASASKGTVTLGRVTAANIAVTGTKNIKINSGNLKATGASGIVLQASNSITKASASASYSLTATNGGVHIQGGPLVLIAGSITAPNGAVMVNAAGSGTGHGITIIGNVSGKTVQIANTGGAGIAVAGITATGTLATPLSIAGDGVVLSNNGQVLATGKIIATAGGVKISAKGNFGADFGSVSAAGNLTVSATAAGPVMSQISVNPTATLKAKLVNLNASASYGGKITTGDIDATGGSITVTASKTAGIGIGPAQVNVGNLTATGGSVHVTANNTSAVSGSGNVKTSNLTASKAVGVLALGPTAALGVSAVNAPNIAISASGKGATVTTGALTAISNAHRADILVNDFTGSAAGNVTVNGNITVSGKLAGASGFNHAYDLPEAARLTLRDSANVGVATKVKVNGVINVTAMAGTYTGLNSGVGEGGITARQSGHGGVANVGISAGGSHGSASVTGAITASGPDAHVNVRAVNINLNNITVTGSGHSVKRHIVKTTLPTGSLNSTNTAGQATVFLGNVPTSSSSSITPTASLRVGNITVSGKGVAQALLFASHISAGNVAATATVATGTRTNTGALATGLCVSNCSNRNSGGFFRTLDGREVNTGHFSGGHADIVMGMNMGSSHTGLTQAKSITAGSLTVSGVGAADISLFGSAVQTKSLSATAGVGNENINGSSHINGSASVGKLVYSVNAKGGEADVKIRGGSNGVVTITGNATATGPDASVDVKGASLTVTGGITVTGNGGASLTTDTVFTPSGTGAKGAAYHTHFTGPGHITGVVMKAKNALNVGGTVKVTGTGIVGVEMIGQSVTLGGSLSASDNGMANYSVLDTRVSPTTNSFNAGDVALFIADFGPSGFVPATVNGNVTLTAKGNISVPDELNVKGTFSAKAGGNIDGSGAGAVLHINEISNVQRGGSGGGGHSGSVASSNLPKLHISALAAKFSAGGSVDLSGGALNIGTGVAPGVTIDSGLGSGLAAAGLSPAVPGPDGYFKAGTNLSLGAITMTGDFLYLQGNTISIAGPVSLPAKSVVQVSPFSATLPIDVEDTTIVASNATSSVITSAFGTTPGTTAVFGLTNQNFLSLFPGDTIVIGNSAESGNVTLASLGKFSLAADTSLIIDTGGTVTGLSGVTASGTGKVVWLESVLGSPVPTPGAVGASAGLSDDTKTGLGDSTDKKKLGSGSNDTGSGGQQNGTVSNGGNTGSGVCH